MLDWLVVGGGPHGAHVAVVLRASGVRSDRIVVLDRESEPLHRWWSFVHNAAMTHLRSPVVHHLDVEPWSLLAHAKAEGFDASHLAAPYQRPSIALFRHHCARTIARHEVDRMRRVGVARSVEIEGEGVRVETSEGVVRARRVVLALGASDRLAWPAWARALLRSERADVPVHHIFEEGFSRDRIGVDSRILVVGGGITAVQLAAVLGEAGTREVYWMSRHEPRLHTFDSDAGWMGPKHMNRFRRDPDPASRRRRILAARHRGSTTEQAWHRLCRQIRAGRVTPLRGQVRTAQRVGEGLGITWEDGVVAVDRVVLATGFDRVRPGGVWVDRLVEAWNLPVGPCGYPWLGSHLRWHPRVFVTGPLAELSLGPTARNLIGARRAAEQIATARG